MNKSWFNLTLLTTAIIGFLAASWLLFPKISSYYYQIKGGGLLRQVTNSGRSNTQIDYTCELNYSQNTSESILVEEAISWLKKAVKLNPSMTHGYLLLGRAYCLKNSPTQAVDEYLNYTNLNPKNPLGHLELAFAYHESCLSHQIEEENLNKTLICNDPNLQIKIRDELGKANVGEDNLIMEAKANFFSGNIQFADKLFGLTSSSRYELSKSDLFLKNLSQIAMRNRISDTVEKADFSIYSINGTTSIRAQDLIWVNDRSELGKLLDGNSSEDQEFGVMWANGTAITVLDNPSPSKYRISILARNSIPPPIKLNLELNFKILDQFSFYKGDLSWETMSTEIFLDQGLHIIGISYMNDDKVGDLDRNAYVGWIQISPIP